MSCCCTSLPWYVHFLVYRNSMEHDILSNILIEEQNRSSDSDSQSSKEKDSDMDVDEEEKLPIKISKQEEKDRANFL